MRKEGLFLSACKNPDPPTLAFLEKARVFPQKSKGFSLRGTPKILGKGRKNARKSKENRKTKKSKEIEKSEDWRVREVGGQFGYLLFSGHFQVTFCGVTFRPFLRHQGI